MSSGEFKSTHELLKQAQEDIAIIRVMSKRWSATKVPEAMRLAMVAEGVLPRDAHQVETDMTADIDLALKFLLGVQDAMASLGDQVNKGRRLTRQARDARESIKGFRV